MVSRSSGVSVCTARPDVDVLVLSTCRRSVPASGRVPPDSSLGTIRNVFGTFMFYTTPSQPVSVSRLDIWECYVSQCPVWLSAMGRLQGHLEYTSVELPTQVGTDAVLLSLSIHHQISSGPAWRNDAALQRRLFSVDSRDGTRYPQYRGTSLYIYEP